MHPFDYNVAIIESKNEIIWIYCAMVSRWLYRDRRYILLITFTSRILDVMNYECIIRSHNTFSRNKVFIHVVIFRFRTLQRRSWKLFFFFFNYSRRKFYNERVSVFIHYFGMNKCAYNTSNILKK